MLHAEIKGKYKEVDFSNFQTKLRNFEDTKSSLLTIKISICYRIVIKWSLQLKTTALQNLLLVFRAANDCLVSLAISLLIDRCIGFITKKYCSQINKDKEIKSQCILTTLAHRTNKAMKSIWEGAKT
jgi:hypothetical protein